MADHWPAAKVNVGMLLQIRCISRDADIHSDSHIRVDCKSSAYHASDIEFLLHRADEVDGSRYLAAGKQPQHLQNDETASAIVQCFASNPLAWQLLEESLVSHGCSRVDPHFLRFELCPRPDIYK